MAKTQADAQGVSEAKGLPEKWSATEHIKWKVELPGVGDGSPCLWGDRVFITASIPEGDELKPGDRSVAGGGVLAISRTLTRASRRSDFGRSVSSF